VNVFSLRRPDGSSPSLRLENPLTLCSADATTFALSEASAAHLLFANVNGQRCKDKYYTNFSKFALTDNDQTSKIKEYSYSEWASSSHSIERLPLKVLKLSLDKNSLPVYGNKPVLICRLKKHYQQIKSAITLQRTFRGFLVRESEKARGPARKDISICNNETDFETMNPLNEIPRECFFSYRDDKGFIYGFNLFSLLSMFKRDRRLVNPYNREDVPFYALQNLFSLYKKTVILYQ
jgi:hypothetical protein